MWTITSRIKAAIVLSLSRVSKAYSVVDYESRMKRKTHTPKRLAAKRSLYSLHTIIPVLFPQNAGVQASRIVSFIASASKPNPTAQRTLETILIPPLKSADSL